MDSETVYGDDPAAMALRWEKEGAKLLHVVDLDGAIQKNPQNLTAIDQILSVIDIPVQFGGGVRSVDTIAMLIDKGVERVVLGTEAIRNPELIRSAAVRFPDRIVVGIDAHKGLVAIEGWTEVTDITAIELARRFEDCGIAAINFTDIHRDGMQTGPNLEETQRLAESVSIPVVASGGVSTLEDIRNLLPLEKAGVVGVITGKALYSGTMNLAAAIQLAG